MLQVRRTWTRSRALPWRCKYRSRGHVATWFVSAYLEQGRECAGAHKLSAALCGIVTWQLDVRWRAFESIILFYYFPSVRWGDLMILWGDVTPMKTIKDTRNSACCDILLLTAYEEKKEAWFTCIKTRAEHDVMTARNIERERWDLGGMLCCDSLKLEHMNMLLKLHLIMILKWKFRSVYIRFLIYSDCHLHTSFCAFSCVPPILAFNEIN